MDKQSNHLVAVLVSIIILLIVVILVIFFSMYSLNGKVAEVTAEKQPIAMSQEEIEKKCEESAKSLYNYEIFKNNTYNIPEKFKYSNKENNYYIVLTGAESDIDLNNSRELEKIYINSETFAVEKIAMSYVFGFKDSVTVKEFVDVLTYMIVKDKYILIDSEYISEFASKANVFFTINQKDDRILKTYNGIETFTIKNGSYKYPDQAKDIGTITVDIKSRKVEIK